MKKSINDLVDQLGKFCSTKYFIRAYSAYKRSFYARFGFYPHSYKCSLFVEKIRQRL